MAEATLNDFFGTATTPKLDDSRNIPQRNNNPGNIRDPGTGQFKTFPSAAEGWKALRNDLTAKISGKTATNLTPNSTLYEFAQVYAPKSDKNDPKEYAERIASELKVKPDTQIGQLHDKVDQFARAIATKEGYFDKPKVRAVAASPAPPSSRVTAADFFGAPKETPKPAVPHSLLTGSIVTTWSGKSIPERYESFLGWFNENLLGKGTSSGYGVRLAEELSKMPAQAVEFATSPAGLALIALNAVPAARPIAGVIDVGLGLQSGGQAVAGAMRIAGGDRSPERVAETIAAAVGAGIGVGGGSKVWGSGIKRVHGADLTERTAMREQITAETDPGKKLSMVLKATPQQASEKIKAAIYRHPFVRDVASYVNIPRPKLLQIAMDLQKDRLGNLEKHIHESNYNAYWLRKDVPAEDLSIQKMGYAIQGDLPEANLSPAARKGLSSIREYQKNQARKIREFYGDKMPLQDAETYITQMWDMKDLANQIRERKGLPMSEEDLGNMVAQRALMKDRYLRERKIPSYKFGIEEGIDIDDENYKLKPLHDNVVDVMKRRDQVLGLAIANQRQANTLRQMGAILSEAEAKKLGVRGWYKQAPEATALAKASYGGRTPTGDPFFEKRPVWVHPDYEMLVNSSFGKGYKQGGLVGLEAARAASKKSVLSLSFFHHIALSEQGHAINILRTNPIKTLQQTFFLNPNFLKGAKMGVWELAGKTGEYDPPAMRIDMQGPALDAIEHGLHLTSTDQEAAVVSWLKNTGKDYGSVGQAVTAPLRFAGKLAHAFDKSLWDFYHQGLQLDGWNTIVGDELKKLGERTGGEPTALQVAEVKRAAADHLNNVYGAINMEELLLSPKSRYWFNMLLLAPAWTASNLRAPMQAFENETGARLASKWAAGAALSWFLSTQMLNYGLTKYYGNPDKYGKTGGHFTWDNPGAPMTFAGKIIGDMSENSLNVAAGYNPNGTERYYKLGKAYREPFSLFMDPVRFIGTKSGLIPHQIITQLATTDPGTGYKEIDLTKPGTEVLLQRIAVLSGLVIPFGLRSGVQAAGHAVSPTAIPAPQNPSSPLGLTTVGGITVSKAATALRIAIDEGRPDVVQAIMQAARANHINPQQVWANYKRTLSTERRQRRGPAVIYDPYGQAVGQPPPASRGEATAQDFFGGR